jgi:drug/metabolite transporter (DMT)-like permease
MSKRDRLIIVLSYLTIYIVWGSTYFAIKQAVATIPPFYVIGFRFTIGGLLLLLFSYLTGRITALPTWHEILAAVFLGLFLLVVGNGLITVAEQKVDSYLASLTVAATPIFVAFFDRVLIGKRISLLRVAAIAIGLAGVALLLYDGHSLASSLTPEMLMVVGGVASWAFATSLGHRLHVYKDSLVNSSMQMIFVGIVSLAGSSFLYPPLSQVLPTISRNSALGLAYLALFGSLAYAAYNHLIAHEPAARAISYSLVNPVIALLLGLLLGNESPAPLLAAGLPLILIGVFLMLYGEASVERVKRWLGVR